MAQIYVVGIEGGSAAVGMIDAEVGQPIQQGVVADISGSLIRVVSGTKIGDAWIFNTDCYLNSGVANTTYGFPTGVNCVSFSHHSDFNGKTVFDANKATGFCFSDEPQIPSSYGRSN